MTKTIKHFFKAYKLSRRLGWSFKKSIKFAYNNYKANKAYEKRRNEFNAFMEEYHND